MGVSGDCDPSTSIVGDGSPEKAQIARALRVAARRGVARLGSIGHRRTGRAKVWLNQALTTFD
jgi:hypothetical protein